MLNANKLPVSQFVTTNEAQLRSKRALEHKIQEANLHLSNDNTELETKCLEEALDEWDKSTSAPIHYPM